MVDSDNNVKYFTIQETNLLSEIVYDVLSLNSEGFSALIKLGAIYVNNQRQARDGFVPQNSSLRVHTKPLGFLLLSGGLFSSRLFRRLLRQC